MSILVDENTRLVIQGITGSEGSFHARHCRAYGTRVVAGVTPGKGGIDFDGLPVYNTVQEAVKKEGANTSIIFVPAPFASDAIMEAAESGIDLVVCITEGIPVRDMMKVKRYLDGRKTKLVGPNCPGIISPGSRVRVGIMPGYIHIPGPVGVISRSGSMTYEVVFRLTKKKIGQSTCIGIGGDPIMGMNFTDCLELFEKDSETKAVVMVGEIGGRAEEEAAWFVKAQMKKPVVAYICGRTAPQEKRMGHAGAIISDGKGTALEKIEVLKAAGVQVAETLDEISPKVTKVLKKG